MDAVKILGSLLGGGSMSSSQGGNLIGSLLGGSQGGSGGGIADMLGSALGGSQGGSGGGLAGMLGSALGGGAGGGQTGAGGGLAGMLGSALGGGGSAGGGSGVGGALGGVAMAALVKFAAGKMGGSGAETPDLGALLGGGGQDDTGGLSFAGLAAPEVNNQAELLIEAMINAAKADGRVDAQEEQTILERLGELEPDEVAFVQSKLRGPVDAAGFAARVPKTMAREVYATSLLAMELDEQSEALYLRDLAQGLGLDAASCNAIHGDMGAPALYR